MKNQVTNTLHMFLYLSVWSTHQWMCWSGFITEISSFFFTSHGRTSVPGQSRNNMKTYSRNMMTCTLFLTFYEILGLLWKSEAEARDKEETIWRWRFIRVFQRAYLSMLKTFWLISQNKGSMKITMLLALCFSLTYFKKSAEHRGQCKSMARCNYSLYQNRIWGQMFCSSLFDCFPYCIIAQPG